jgi:hypothetical protein
MARPISWVERAPAILHEVKVKKRTRYGAGDIQDLFGLMPRRAQALMKMLPRFEIGRTFEISREDLIAFLERVVDAAPPGCGHHAAGKAVAALFSRILASAPPVTREQPPLPLASPIRLTPRRSLPLASLPESVLVRRGVIEIHARTREEATEALLAISTVIETDEFAARFELSKPVGRVDSEVREMFEELEQMEAAYAKGA